MATVTFGVVTGALGFARPVAIKRIHPTLASETAVREAIRDEARIAARIRHPNVVSVIDVIEDGENVGIVLEYVHGESLSALLEQAAMRHAQVPVAVAVAVFIDVLHGLHAAHEAVDEKGAALAVIHRDVSPQNVMVGADGVARVLDFGISKAEKRSTVTREGQVKGKLRYMAPEQLGGTVSVATDTYAVGLVLWETLAGSSPFGAVDHDAELVGRVLMGISRAPSSLRAEVPPALDAIIARALAVTVENRFRAASEMAAALESSGLAASRTAVAAWVDELAHDVLAERARIVVQLERSAESAGSIPPPQPGQPGKTVDTAVAMSVARKPLVSPRPWLIGGAALALVAAAGTAVLVRPSRPAASALRGDAPAATALASSIPSASSSSATALSTPPRGVAGSASAESVGDAIADRDAAAAVRAAPPSGPPPGRLRKARSGAPDCGVPYTVDANGYRRYQRECFE